jgi:hypothetical protein
MSNSLNINFVSEIFEYYVQFSTNATFLIK